MNLGKDKIIERSHVQGWLRKVNPVVNKDGPLCPNTVYLSREKACTFGRSTTGVTTQLISRTTPLMISRKHATVGFRDGQYTITDHESLNGVFVNGCKIKPNEPYPIVSGDKIAFGIAVGNSKAPEFEYLFHEVAQDCSLKRGRLNDEVGTSNGKKRKCDAVYLNDNCSQKVESAFEERINIQENKIKELTAALSSKEQAHNNLAVTLEKKEQDLLEKLEKQREELETEKIEAERHLQDLLEQQLVEKENILKKNFEERLKAVELERDVVERNLQKELNDRLTEKDETYKEELEKQKEALNKILLEMKVERENREIEMVRNQELLNNLKSVKENEKHLGSCLEELKRQIQEKDEDLLRQEEITKKAEEDGKKAMLSQMEDEFTCMVCHELFVDAVTLPCAHSFCEMCLRSWMKKKKECPVCRGRITGRAVKSIVLDSAISKMIENADIETKQNRQQLLQQRNALKEAEQEDTSITKEENFEDANGFEPLLVSDPDHLNDQRGSGSDHGNFSQSFQHHSSHSNSRNNTHHMNIQGNGRSNSSNSYGRNHYRDGGSNANRNRDRRPPSYDTRRNWGNTVQARPFSGNCFICGNQGHFARNCFFSHT